MKQESQPKLVIHDAIRHLMGKVEFDAPFNFRWLEAAQAAGTAVQRLAEVLKPLTETLAHVDWAAAQQRLGELPSKSKVAMSVAACRGWFFGWNDSFQGLVQLVEKLETASPSDIDDIMVDYYRTNFESFTADLLSRYPNRGPVLKAAIDAHLRGGDGYYLSIPVFIAQADGLLTEVTRVQSALMRDGKKRELQASKAVRDQLAQSQESLSQVEQILNLHNLDLMKSADARRAAEQAAGKPFDALNRHQVLHGESWDYGTEINSLRAFSFLVNVAVHVPMILEREQRP